uniref:COMM domain-containing protein n=3 Tax=Macrostomum lignano TaxID=282301 RepID=A0A1I8IMR7_9PLAT
LILFHLQDSRDKLAEQLRQLEANGLPRPVQDQNLQLNSMSLDLEPSWDRVVAQGSITSAKMLKQQAAIWELFQTEINILRHLKTIIEVSRQWKKG